MIPSPSPARPLGEPPRLVPAPPPPPAPVLLHTPRYLEFDYGPHHPMRVSRLGLAIELMELCGLAEPCLPFRPATLEELVAGHDRRYLEALRELSGPAAGPGIGLHGLGPGDNPVFPGLFEFVSLLAGASLEAARQVRDHGRSAAFNPAGGMHHALPGRATGFCYVNDPVLVIRELLKTAERVVYLDIDAHHGDGVQWAFYESPRVLTISLHQHPATLFPGTGFIEEMGRGAGRGYAVNLPLWPDTNDEIYRQAFEAVIPPLVAAFRPDYLVSQLGTDALMGDPLANLNLTTRGLLGVLTRIRELARGRWVALGGGGYHSLNAARAWTLAWAVMRGREAELPERLPPEFIGRHRLAPEDAWLLEPVELVRGRRHGRARHEAQEAVAQIQREIFPLLGARPA